MTNFGHISAAKEPRSRTPFKAVPSGFGGTALVSALVSVLLCLVAPEAGAQRYDRGYDTAHQPVFAPKGTFMAGGNARFTYHSMENYKFLIADGINSNGYTVSATPTFLYMVKDNIGIGASLSYKRTLIDLKSANLSLSELNMDFEDYYRLSQSFGAAAAFRPYIPLGDSGRFSMFAQVNLGLSLGKVKNTALVSGETKGTYTGQYKIYAGVNPGITALLTNHIAMEVCVGVLGFSYGWTDQTHNQVTGGSSSNSNASFSLNLASIAIGLAYYL